MDSIEVQAIHMPQTSAHKKIEFGDVNAAGTYYFDWKVSSGTIVDSVTVLVQTVFNTGGAATIVVGDGTTANLHLASVDIKTSAAASTTAIANRMKPVAKYEKQKTYFDTLATAANAEEEHSDAKYRVRATVAVAGTVATTGSMWVWFDYRFDPNVKYS